MRLDGKVNTIERIIARGQRGIGVAEEKRVYKLTVRLPDKSLEAQYSYGYGNMNFILHGRAMNDFVDLGGEVDVYVIPKGQEAPSQTILSDLLTQLYGLEGDVATLTASNAHLKECEDSARQENQALRQRLHIAMEEVMRLEARLGVDPPAPALLGEPDDA